MAMNDFLTVDQVCEMLGKSAEEIETLVAEGHLTPVWDGDVAYYRRGEIEQVAAKEGSSIVDLAAEDVSGEEPGESFASALKDLADASSGLDLLDASPVFEEAAQAAPAELDLDEIPLDLPAAPKGGAGKSGIAAAETKPSPAAPEPIMLDPGVPDLGLSGSSIISLDAGLEEPQPSVTKPAGGKKIGISVFDDEEAGIEPDPMGETQIAATVPELESVGSGSGLLDLTRESDDTSLGPELLDVISPSAEETETETEAILAQPGEDSDQMSDAVSTTESPYETPMPAMVAARSSAAAAPGVVPLNVCALLGILALALVGLSTAAAIQGVWPAFLNVIAKDLYHYVTFGALGLAAILTGIIGIMQGRK